MMRRTIPIMLAIVLFGLLLVACGGQAQQAIQEVAPTLEAAAQEVAPTVQAAAEELAPTVEAAAAEVQSAATEMAAGDAEMSGLPDLEGREIAIAVENAYLPFNYIDPDTGEPAGWDYVVWDEICNLLNCTPVYIESGWEGMIQAVADGQFDAAADGITITEDRAEIVDFSEGYINIDQRLLVRLDDDRIESIDDIVNDESLVLGTQVGTTNYETAATFLPESRIQAFEQFPFAVQALIAGDVDAVIIDEVAGQGYLGENADQLKLVGPSMSSDQLGFIYPLGSDLVEPVNAALNELKANGFLQQINLQYFGPGFDVTYEDLFPEEESEGAAQESVELPDLDGREVTIAVENAYLPFNYIDPDTGEPAGWDYVVWDEICNLLNCTPVYIESGWEGMIQAVADGQFDAAADGITITEDRAEIVDFSEGYINIDQRLLVRLDDDRIESIDDIVNDESLVLGTQVGTTNYETAATFLPESRIQAFEQFPFAVQALIAGDVDAVIIDEVAGQGYLGENADQLKLVGPSMSSDQLGFIYPLGSDLVEPVNAALNELKANGFLEEVNLEYFGPGFTVTYEDLE
ncbi:MAG: substrate-binding periplasmic protein [Candidatus Promineifilaceae bacterium]